MMARRGFTLIELLAVIVILAIIALIATPMILGVIDSAKKGAAESSTYGFIDAIAKSSLQKMIENGNYETKPDGTYDLTTLTEVKYKGKIPTTVCVVIKAGNVESGSFEFDQYIVDYQNGKAKVNPEKTEINCEVTTPSPEENEFNADKGVNSPKLTEGMIPIKWDSSNNEIETTVNDPDWYDYNAKKWANVKTADGSYFVWIPRYIYKISSGWHTSNAGTIEIQFTKNTDDNWNSPVIGNIDTDSGANASNNKWTNHPAFTFGTDELNGIWVAKFEASGTINAIDIKPNVSSLRSLNINSMFEASRNMEKNSKYGWGATGTGIDTHMMKNIEWGAIAYLSQSKYGKETEEVWINPANSYVTGCAGNSVSSNVTTGCLNQYQTLNGVKASTTGTIYGIYDMSGGADEYVMANLSKLSGSSGITDVSLIDPKYIDIYSGYSASTKGDAMYETSSAAEGQLGWYNDTTMPFNTTKPWLRRGGYHTDATKAGIFHFFYNDLAGGAGVAFGFRPVLLVNENL